MAEPWVKAVADLEEQMEELMREAIRMVREELREKVDGCMRTQEEFKEVVVESLEKIAVQMEKQEQFRKKSEGHILLTTIAEEDEGSKEGALEEQPFGRQTSNSQNSSALAEQVHQRLLKEIQLDYAPRGVVDALRDKLEKTLADELALARTLASDMQGLRETLAQQQDALSALAFRGKSESNPGSLEGIREAVLSELQNHGLLTEINGDHPSSKMTGTSAHHEQSDLVARQDLQSWREAVSLEFAGHLEATKEQLNARISEMHAQLYERGSDQLREMMDLMQDMRTQLSEVSLRSDTISRSELEAVQGAMRSEVQQHTAGTEKHVDKKISDLLAFSDQFSEMRAQLQELRAKMAEYNCQPEVVTTGDLEAKFSDALAGMSQMMGESTANQFSEMRAQLQEIRARLSECNIPQDVLTRSDLDAKLPDLLSNVSEIMGESTAAQFSEVRAQIQDIFKQLSGGALQQDVVSRSDLESIRAAFVEFQAETEATMDLVNKKISEVNLQLSEVKDERTNGQISGLEAQMEEMRAQFAESTMHGSDSEAARDMFLSGGLPSGASTPKPGQSLKIASV